MTVYSCYKVITFFRHKTIKIAIKISPSFNIPSILKMIHLQIARKEEYNFVESIVTI